MRWQNPGNPINETQDIVVVVIAVAVAVAVAVVCTYAIGRAEDRLGHPVVGHYNIEGYVCVSVSVSVCVCVVCSCMCGLFGLLLTAWRSGRAPGRLGFDQGITQVHGIL